MERDVTSHQPNICELLAELPVLLVAQGLERGGVDDPLLVPERHGDGILGNDGLPRGSVRGDKHGLVPLQARDGGALEGVELERVLLGHLPVEVRVGERPVHRLVLGRLVPFRDGDLVDARAGEVPALGRRVRLRLRLRRRGARLLLRARVRRLALAGALRLFPHRPPLDPNLRYRTQRRVSRSDANTRFGCLVSHSREGKTKGWAYLAVLVTGEGPEEDLGTWRWAAAAVAQSSPRERETARAAGGVGGLGLAAPAGEWRMEAGAGSPAGITGLL